MKAIHPKLQAYFDRHPVVEIYKGYEIRSDDTELYGKTYKGFLVDAAIAIYSMSSTFIEGCYEFIDELVSCGIMQYDDEAVSRFVFSRR